MYKYLLCFSSSTPSPGVFYKMHAFERRMSVYPCGQTTCNNPISTNPTLTRSRSRSPVAIRSLCSYQVPAFEKVCTEQHVFWPSAASPGNVSRGAQVEIVCFFLRLFESCSPRMYGFVWPWTAMSPVSFCSWCLCIARISARLWSSRKLCSRWKLLCGQELLCLASTMHRMFQRKDMEIRA